MNIAGLLENAATAFGDRPAVTIGSTSTYLDYRGLARAAAGLAAALRERFGLRPGESVLLAMNNNRDYLTILFACWQAGLVAVPVNAKLHEREIAFIAEDCGARLAFASPAIAHGIAPLLPELMIVLAESVEFDRLSRSDPLPTAETASDDTAWIFYTSGTTGRPKGALLSHRNLMAMAVAYLADVDFLGPEDSLLHLAATSHASGLFGLSHVAKASNNILPEAGGYDADEMARIIGHQTSLTFFAPTTLLNRMVEDRPVADAPLRNIRTILTGAGPVYADDIRRALGFFGPKLWNGYGQGETPCTITAMPKALLWDAWQRGADARLTSVGIPRTGISVKVVGPDGREVAPGEIGEVIVQGETVMKGYLNRPEATAEALAGGWLHTGDLGRFEETGFLHLSDRMKDMIISGGMNVYAREVEEALLAHPALSEAAVIGARDAKWGESVLALVVPRAGMPAPAPAELDALCLERLARFKRPKLYLFVDRLPKNSAGKVLKTNLRREHENIFLETGSHAANS
jgi:long-chain acyl-CoA synthetase